MKKMIVLIGIILSVTTNARAGDIVKMPMESYTPVAGFDYIFKVKTTKFDKVILDCQSFITGIDFSNGGILKSHVPLDMFSCEDMVSFLNESKANNQAVCMGLDIENSLLYMSHDAGDECK
jgi:hypothetical protein